MLSPERFLPFAFVHKCLNGVIVPRGRQVLAVKADVAPAFDEARVEVWVFVPGEMGVGTGWNPRIIERVNQQGRSANAEQELTRRTFGVIVVGSVKAVARRDKFFVKLVDGTRGKNRLAVLLTDFGYAAEALFDEAAK